MECDETVLVESSKLPIFQSTHSHGVRQIKTEKPNNYTVFQSTHSHGVRPLETWMRYKILADFNQRTRMECDQR